MLLSSCANQQENIVPVLEDVNIKKYWFYKTILLIMYLKNCLDTWKLNRSNEVEWSAKFN